MITIKDTLDQSPTEKEMPFSGTVRVSEIGDTFVISNELVLKYQKALRKSGTNPLFYFALFTHVHSRSISTYATDFRLSGLRQTREIGDHYKVSFGNLDQETKNFDLTIRSTKPVRVEKILDGDNPKDILKQRRKSISQ